MARHRTQAKDRRRALRDKENEMRRNSLNQLLFDAQHERSKAGTAFLVQDSKQISEVR